MCTLKDMKNITLSAQDQLIDELRQVSERQNTTVNDLFRLWSKAYIARVKKRESEQRLRALRESVEKFSFKSDRKYTREEMNER